MENTRNYALPFSEYLKNPSRKFAIGITKNQYVIEYGEHTIHQGMIYDIVQKTRPDLSPLKYSIALDDYFDSNVILCGFSGTSRSTGFMQISLPERDLLSVEQFECLRSILLAIKEYNLHCFERDGVQGYQCEIVAGAAQMGIVVELDSTFDIDRVISELAKCVGDKKQAREETIVGIPLEKSKKTAEEIIAEYASIGSYSRK